MYVHIVKRSCCSVPVSLLFLCNIGQVGACWQSVNVVCREGGVLPKVAKSLGRATGEIISPWGPLQTPFLA